jgi:hypothetical protein
MKSFGLVALSMLAFAACGGNPISDTHTTSGGTSGQPGNDPTLNTGGNTAGTTAGSTTAGTTAGSTNGGTTGGQSTAGTPTPTPCTGGFVCPAFSAVFGSQVTKPYPTNSCGGPFLNSGETVADVTLGLGCEQLTGGNPRFCELKPVDFNFLYCSGYKYALLDISASWCGACQQEASALPSMTAGWRAKGGIVFSVLAEGQVQGSASTKADLVAWWDQFGTNYPMAIDPSHQLYPAFPGNGLPMNAIIDLSTMKVVYTESGYGNEFAKMDQLLGM